MKEQNMSRADFVMSLFLLAFGTAVTILSSVMPRFEDRNVNPYSVPGLVPGILGVILALLGASMCLRSVRRGGGRLGLTGAAVANFFAAQETRRILLTIGLGVVYGLGLLGRAHFMIATALFVFAFVWLFEFRRGVGIGAQRKTLFFGLILACATSASVYVVFTRLFLVNLP